MEIADTTWALTNMMNVWNDELVGFELVYLKSLQVENY